jgi:hypothetical protein
MRFVILEHHDANGIHWDLLLEQPYGGLRSWRLETCPPGPGWKIAVPLPVHRDAYLTYEGPIPARYGWVRRWDRGTFRLVCDTAETVRLLLDGQRLVGCLELERRAAAAVYRFLAQSPLEHH